MLYQSISDMQDTIRAIDIKLGFISVLLFLPITNFEEIFKIEAILSNFTFSQILVSIQLSLWSLSVWTLYLGLNAIKYPSNLKEDSNKKIKDCFYNGDIFDFSWKDVYLNFDKKNYKNLDVKYNELPSSRKKLKKYLIFEIAKLAYIRDIKLLRVRHCIIFSCLFIFVSLIAKISIL